MVHQLLVRKTKQIVAVKTFDADALHLAHNECNVYRKLKSTGNPFVAKFYGAEENACYFHLILQFCEGGDLFRRFERLREEQVDISGHVVFYMAELVCALELIHASHVVVNDLKTENVALDAEGHVCLIDFGLSAMNVTSPSQLTEVYGSAHSMAPEKVSGQGYGTPADMYALGCVLYEMCTGQRPCAYAREGGGSKLDDVVLQNLPDVYRDAIKVLTLEDPDVRVTATQFKTNQLFYGVDWSKVATKQLKAPWTPCVDGDHFALDPDAFDPALLTKPDFNLFRLASSPYSMI